MTTQWPIAGVHPVVEHDAAVDQLVGLWIATVIPVAPAAHSSAHVAAADRGRPSLMDLGQRQVSRQAQRLGGGAQGGEAQPVSALELQSA
jgi:hypothetical protein